jgi:hypothetical protein
VIVQQLQCLAWQQGSESTEGARVTLARRDRTLVEGHGGGNGGVGDAQMLHGELSPGSPCLFSAQVR